MSCSGMRRRRGRSARPRLASRAADRLCVRFALTLVALPGRNDPSIDLATVPGPIDVHHGQRDPLSYAHSDHPALTVVAARIYALQRCTLEHLRRELEVESALLQVSLALASIPTEAHSSPEYTDVYTSRARGCQHMQQVDRDLLTNKQGRTWRK